MRTNLVMVIDRSGSMAGLALEASTAINRFITEQQQVPGKCRFTMVEFDSGGIDVLHDNVDLADVTANYQLVAREMTPLLDAVGQTIGRIDQQVVNRAAANKAPFDKVIFVIMTDGLENASQEFTRDAISGLVLERTNQRSWDFVYLGAGFDQFGREQQFAQAANTGVSRGSTLTYDHSAKGYASAMSTASASVASARATGAPVEFTDDDRKRVDEANND